jgi:hypothetical protein
MPKQFPIPQIERAIHEALNPRGMSTHDGKVTLDASWVQRLLILADQADLVAAQQTIQHKSEVIAWTVDRAVAAEAQLDKALAALKWLDASGGLGLDKHARILETLKECGK